MGFWKGLFDKASQKAAELEAEAKRRAAKKAAELALDTGKAAARSAVKNAGKTLDYAGKKLGEALFGETEDDAAPPQEGADRPDPFAKLKAEEAARKRAAVEDARAARAGTERKASARAEHEKAEREVDDELAALKKKIRG